MNKLILEEIQRIKLLSKYNNSKTLSEQTIPGGISQQAYDKIMSISATNRKNLRGGDLFPAQQSEINKEFGTDTYTKFYRNGGEALLKSGVAQKTAAAAKGAESLLNRKQLEDAGVAQKTGAAAKGAESLKAGQTKQPAKPVATPPELKDVKAFQDWLDVNAKGWATGYKDGIINKGQNGGGYGRFGPRTQKAWATYKDQFLKGGTTTQTPPKIEGAAQQPAAQQPAAQQPAAQQPAAQQPAAQQPAAQQVTGYEDYTTTSID